MRDTMGPADDKGQFDPKAAEARVSGWLGEFGLALKGIVSSDDCFCQEGINEALRKAGRQDIILVSAGSTPAGMQLVKEGKLQAITFQSAQADGALPMKVAIDWFNGLSIEPLNYLPKYIITRDNIDDFIAKKPEFLSVSLELLTRAILNGEVQGVDSFFEDAYQSFLSSEVMTTEFFRGFRQSFDPRAPGKDERHGRQPFQSDYEPVQNLFEKTRTHGMDDFLSVIRHRPGAQDGNRSADHPYVNGNFSSPVIKTLYAVRPPRPASAAYKEVGSHTPPEQAAPASGRAAHGPQDQRIKRTDMRA
jgi:hypothetical protein